MRQGSAFRRMLVGMDQRKDVIEQFKGELGFRVFTADAQDFQWVQAKGGEYGFLCSALPGDLQQDAVPAFGANHRPAAFTVQVCNKPAGPTIDAMRPFNIHCLPGKMPLRLFQPSPPAS